MWVNEFPSLHNETDVDDQRRASFKLSDCAEYGKARRRARIILLEDEDAAEDPSKLGRKVSCLQIRTLLCCEVRKNMVMYLKNQAGYKQSYFKGMKYEEIRPIFEKVWDQTHTFVPMDSEDKEKADYEQEKAELRLWLKVAQDDEESVNPEILFTKYLIVDWGYQLLGQVGGKDFEVYKLTRDDGSASYHANIQAFLRRLDREDMSTIYILVQERFQDHPLKGRDLLLWGDLIMIFNPDKKDDIWMNQTRT
ncbi:hypothetical protein Tco_0694245 [Tanacetum coccineum]